MSNTGHRDSFVGIEADADDVPDTARLLLLAAAAAAAAAAVAAAAADPARLLPPTTPAVAVAADDSVPARHKSLPLPSLQPRQEMLERSLVLLLLLPAASLFPVVLQALQALQASAGQGTG